MIQTVITTHMLLCRSTQSTTKPSPFTRLPVEVETCIGEFCLESDLLALSSTNTYHNHAMAELREIRKAGKLEAMDSFHQTLLHFVRKAYPAAPMVQVDDLRMDIVHYLHGFEGQLDWLMGYFGRFDTMSVAARLDLENKLQDYRQRYSVAFKRPIHRKAHVPVLPASLLIFDEFITLNDEMNAAMRGLWKPYSPSESVSHKAITEMKMMMEQIGVLIGYPGLETRQWAGNKGPDSWQRGRQLWTILARHALGHHETAWDSVLEELWRPFAQNFVPKLLEFTGRVPSVIA